MESIPEDASILIVDDDSGLLLSVRATLMSAGIPEPAVVSDSRRVLDIIKKNRFQLVLIDLIMPHINGMILLEQIRKEYPEIVCIIVTATDEVSSAIQAIRLGAYDYLVKPVDPDDLVIIIRRALERYDLRRKVTRLERRRAFSDIANPEAFSDMIAEDESMAFVFHQVEAVAPTDYSVVITGESGTGKEMLSRIVHRLSHRANKPFIAVNMAAFNQTLFEDAFFGHIKGAFTQAVQDQTGFFEAAEGGTLFLDEITELEPSLQGKLLRVLQEKEFYRLGSTSSKRIDVRILAASNRDILDEVKKERFRADLFYRLSMYTIKIPPLRERKKDIIPLANHFVKKYGVQKTPAILSISKELEANLQNYAFPGNIRELENMIASAVLLESQTILQTTSVRALPQRMTEQKNMDVEWLTLEELEKQHILRALKKMNGNRKKAAKILGINTATVYRKIEKYGISE